MHNFYNQNWRFFKKKTFLKVGIFLKSSALVCTLSSFVHMLCFQLVNYNICCKDTKCAWGNNYFLYWNFDQKNAIFFHRWNECDKIHNSTFSNQNLRIWFFLFQIRWKKKSRYSIEFGKEILDFTKQCALSWNHSLLITLTRDILWRFYVVAVWQILFQFRKKNIYEKDTFLKKRCSGYKYVLHLFLYFSL